MGPMSSTDADCGLLKDTRDDSRLLSRHGAALLSLARTSIAWRLREGSLLSVDLNIYSTELRDNRAAFVTLNKGGDLRGCVGTPSAWRPLVEDIAENAGAAAVEDRRFPPVTLSELDGIEIEISLLGVAMQIQAQTEAELVSQLRPGIDGLILRDVRRQALFLPQVWAHLENPVAFLANLKVKAGLAADYWSPSLAFERFTSVSIAESDLVTRP